MALISSSALRHMGITERFPCLGGCVLRDSALRIRAVPALANLPRTESASTGTLLFTVRTQRSAYEFRFGLRAASRRLFTPPAASVSRNDAQNLVSRSCNQKPILRRLSHPSPSKVAFRAVGSRTGAVFRRSSLSVLLTVSSGSAALASQHLGPSGLISGADGLPKIARDFSGPRPREYRSRTSLAKGGPQGRSPPNRPRPKSFFFRSKLSLL
jgi:hypothetical protein